MGGSNRRDKKRLRQYKLQFRRQDVAKPKNYALGNAQFVPGQVYNNTKLGVRINVLRRKGSSFIVEVWRTK